MKRVLLVGFICVILNNFLFQETYSMSGKKLKKIQPIEEIKPQENGNTGLKEEQKSDSKETVISKEPIKKEVKTYKPLEVLNVKLMKDNIAGLIAELETENSKLRTYGLDYYKKEYEVYTKELVEIVRLDLEGYRVTSVPYMSDYDILVENNMLYFETKYQGTYFLELIDSFGKKTPIKINVKHKYHFTEQENYDIILNSYLNNDIKAFKDSKTLFLTSFPDSFNIKEVYFMNLKLLLKNGSESEILEGINEIEKTFILSEEKKKELLLLKEEHYPRDSREREEILYKNLSIDSFREKLKDQLLIKEKLEERDTQFLEEYYYQEFNIQVANKLGRHFEEDGDNIKALKYYGYSNENYKIANIYLEDRRWELFEEEISKVSATEREKLLRKKSEIETRDEISKLIGIGNGKVEDNNYQEAILFYNRAKKVDEKLSTEYSIDLELGKSYYNLFEYDIAISYLKKMLGKRNLSDIDRLETNYYTAMSYYRGEKFDESLKYFNLVVEEYPKTSLAKKSMIYIIRLNKE